LYKRKNLLLVILLLFVLSVFGGLFSPPLYAQECKCGEKCKLVIIHTNDFHGNLLPQKAKRVSKTSKVGGSAYIATLIEKIRKENKGKCLLLDAGDIAQGTPVSNYFKGKPVVEVMNYLNYDAMTIGNHEFDWRQPALKEMIKLAKFPVVCANVVYEKDPARTIFDVKPYIIKRVNGINVGILGLTTPRTPIITKAVNVKGLKFLDPAKTAIKYIPKMKKDGADIIIALTHLGFQDDIKLAKDVKGIDIIVGGHSHTKLINPKKVGNTIIVQASKYGRYVGKLELEVCSKGKKIESYTEKNELIPVINSELTPDKQVVKIIMKYEDKIAPIMKKVVGKTEVDLVRSKGKGNADCNLGDLITDGIRAKTGADVALYNSGGIRAEIYAGDIKAEDVFKVLPFENWLVTARMKGEDIVKLLEHGASGKYGSAQVSGVTFSIDYSKPKMSRLSDVMIGGKPLKKDKYYIISTIDFVFGGGDGYDFKNARDIKYGDHIRDVITEYIKKNSPLKIKADGRIKVIKGGK